jgi:RimJ/RimL family protein N-acetyltransferase
MNDWALFRLCRLADTYLHRRMNYLMSGVQRLSDEPVKRIPERKLSGNPVEPLPPALWPSRIPLKGRHALLEPVLPGKHLEDLYRAGHEVDGYEDVWTYLPYGPFPDRRAFAVWLRDCAASADPIFYVIADQHRERFLGMASLMDIQPKLGAIEIGHIWFGPELQRSRTATEALYLMMTYALDGLRNRRLQWKCNALNQGSRNAALRLGFEFEGILYQHQIPKGNNRDTAYYSILDYEWPLIHENFKVWLDDSNFVDDGAQKRSLGEMNRALRTRPEE